MTRPEPASIDPTGSRPAPSRRDVLRTAGIVAVSGGAVLTLAACGAEGQAGAPVPTAAAPSSSAASAPGTPSGSASASDSPSASASSQAPSGPSVATADVPVGSGVILDDADYVVTQPSEGTFKAFSKTCTHKGCPVSSVSADGIVCNCHGSVFSVEDGSVVKKPADEPLAEARTTVSGARVYVG